MKTANGSYLWRHPARPEAEGATHAVLHVNLSGERTENAEQRRSVCCFVLRAQIGGLFFLSLFREKGNKERAGSIQKYSPSKMTDRREERNGTINLANREQRDRET